MKKLKLWSGGEEEAQSVALGFVIIMGIAITTSVILFSIQVPVQTSKFEFKHEQNMPNDFARLSTAIDDVALAGSASGAGAGAGAFETVVVGMKPGSIPQLGIIASGGTLSFNSSNSTEKFECVACSPEEEATNLSGSYSWLWNNPYDYKNKSHVDIFADGVRLQLESGKNMIFNSSGDEYLSGEYWCNNFSVYNGTNLNTPWLYIHAKHIYVGPNSTINATGRGLAGGTTIPEWGTPMSANGTGEGGGKIPTCRHPTYDYCYCGAGGGGAGHWGKGGDGGYSWTGPGPYCSGCSEENHTDDVKNKTGGQKYENDATLENTSVAYPGSGGACGAWGQVANGYIYEGGAGGDGGGVIILDAPIINISGKVTVDGEDGHYSNDLDRADDSAGGGGGGGSGGTILIKGGKVTIIGTLSARGGNGANGAKACDDSPTYDSNGGGGGGGGGGVIKVFNKTCLYDAEGPMNYTQFQEKHTNVSGGAGGLGGVGNGTYCLAPSDGGPYPTPGGNGSPGGDGIVYNQSYEYVESIPHFPSGYIVSKPFDAGNNSTAGINTSMVLYGNISWNATTPSGTFIIMKVRTSPNEDMSGATPWPECLPVKNGADISDLHSVSNGHRYVQWRAELYTYERSRTPVLHSVCINYSYGKPVIATCSGSIEFNSSYFYAPNFVLTYAHGGTIKSQRQGKSFMLLPPPISIARNGNTTDIRITAVDLIGNTRFVSGLPTHTIKITNGSSDLLAGGLEFNNITLNFYTAHPEAWYDWFNKTCNDTGLNWSKPPVNWSKAPVYYINDSATDRLQVVFYGNETYPIRLWLKRERAEVKIEIEEI